MVTNSATKKVGSEAEGHLARHDSATSTCHYGGDTATDTETHAGR